MHIWTAHTRTEPAYCAWFDWSCDSIHVEPVTTTYSRYKATFPNSSARHSYSIEITRWSKAFPLVTNSREHVRALQPQCAAEKLSCCRPLCVILRAGIIGRDVCGAQEFPHQIGVEVEEGEAERRAITVTDSNKVYV